MSICLLDVFIVGMLARVELLLLTMEFNLRSCCMGIDIGLICAFYQLRFRWRAGIGKNMLYKDDITMTAGVGEIAFIPIKWDEITRVGNISAAFSAHHKAYSVLGYDLFSDQNPSRQHLTDRVRVPSTVSPVPSLDLGSFHLHFHSRKEQTESTAIQGYEHRLENTKNPTNQFVIENCARCWNIQHLAFSCMLF
jgi:hypothetical protein